MLHYDEYGDRRHPAILLLHGAGALDTFCQQYRLADRYRLIVPHLPGAGQAAEVAYDPVQTIRALWALIESLGEEPIGVIGHSLGGQLAVMLVSQRPERFRFAVFLSAWVNPTPKSIRPYVALSGLAAKMLRWRWLVRLQARYWHYTAAQADAMVRDARKLTPRVYSSFFSNTLRLADLPAYGLAETPMLAVCGGRETRDMRTSLALLGQNQHCRTMLLPGAGHDFPMRQAHKLNPILEAFIVPLMSAPAPLSQEVP